jgi:L-proline amide hydrolase
MMLAHGGPGATHDYLEPIAELSKNGRACILYDQIGNGRSTHLRDAPSSFWTVDLFKNELSLLVHELGIAQNYHLLGQSWGGMLAMEHALDRPTGLKSIVVANSPASIPLWVKEANRLRADHPEDVQATLLKHERSETTDDPAYEEAMLVFYNRHLCRVPWPECFQRTFAAIEDDPTVYGTMNGPSEFHVIGTIKDWDITERLHEIDVPTLLISGRYDEATPRVVNEIHKRIEGSEWVLIEEASHSSHLEQPDEFRAAVGDFLDRVEALPSTG